MILYFDIDVLTLIDRGSYLIKSSILVADQWTGFYIIGISIMEELKF